MNDMAERTCKSCAHATGALAGAELEQFRQQLPEGWEVVDDHHLQKEFTFADFREALTFTNHVGELAEEQGHHPDLCLEYGRVEVRIFTHKVDGLTEDDFILAAKVDNLH